VLVNDNPAGWLVYDYLRALQSLTNTVRRDWV
jgi:hypothetical protein